MHAWLLWQGLVNDMRLSDLFEDSPEKKAKITLYTDPNYYGAEVGDSAGNGKPVVQIPLAKLVGFEPDEKMKSAKSSANMNNMIKLIKDGKGSELPPILARRYEGGYQVLDGHHRYHAYKAAGAKTIPAKIIPADEIRIIDKAPTNEAKQRLDPKCWTGYRKQGTKIKNGNSSEHDGVNTVSPVMAFRMDEASTAAHPGQAPTGVIFNGNVAYVGQTHGKPIKLSDDLKKRIQDMAAKHGAWYEGNGADRAHTKDLISSWQGSWDDEAAASITGYPPQFLYVLFANVDANNTIKRVGTDLNDTIFNRIIKNQNSGKFFPDRSYDAATLKKFLSMVSQEGYDFNKMAQQPATAENVKKFFKTGEKLMWPSNLEEYPNPAGKVAKKANDHRDNWLVNRKSGVYVMGAGHLLSIAKIGGFKLIGGERINDSVNENISETKQRLDRKCWTGYKKQGTKLKDGVRVNNCVPTNETTAERGPTLYHGTLTKNVPSIIKSGLLPRVGQFTKNIHGDKATPKVFATTEQGARAVYCALASQIYHAIGHMPSAAEMAKLGAVLVIHKDAGKFSQYDPSAKDVQGSLEPGDYHSDDAIAVDEVLTGQALLDWIKRHDADRSELEMGVTENFADGKGPGRPGDSQRHGIPKHATMAQLEKAAKAPGRKGQLARWQLNMRRGRAKSR
jgi:ParB-like nuclease domain